MKIAHFALWTQQLDVQARFWVDFFASINENTLARPTPALPPILLSIDDEVVIEADDQAWPASRPARNNNHTGWAHLALSVGGAEQVDAIAQRAGAAGILISPPRTTGDGYYGGGDRRSRWQPDRNRRIVSRTPVFRRHPWHITGLSTPHPGPAEIVHFLPPIRQPQL